MTAPDVADATGLGKDKIRTILQRLLRQSTVVCTKVRKGFGSGIKEQPSWKLWPQHPKPLTEDQVQRLHSGVPVEEVLNADPIRAADNTTAAAAEGSFV